jgi:hypothetical protein
VDYTLIKSSRVTDTLALSVVIVETGRGAQVNLERLSRSAVRRLAHVVVTWFILVRCTNPSFMLIGALIIAMSILVRPILFCVNVMTIDPNL